MPKVVARNSYDIWTDCYGRLSGQYDWYVASTAMWHYGRRKYRKLGSYHAIDLRINTKFGYDWAQVNIHLNTKLFR